jgi:FixJ family two-component response regulator
MPMTEQNDPIILILSDEATMRESLTALLESVGLQAFAFASIDDLVAAYQSGQYGCLLVDMQLPIVNGLQVQQELLVYGIDLPLIIITNQADVPTAVAAIKAGALDFIEKPYNDQLLLDCVHNALLENQSRRCVDTQRQRLLARFNSLTPREREVMEKVVRGMSNKAIAEALLVSRKTVEVHRAKVMDKIGVSKLSELISMAMEVGIIRDYADESDVD